MQMSVVGHQGSGVAGGFSFSKDIRQFLDKLIAVAVVAKDLTLLDTPDDDVMKCTGSIYACFTRHAFFLTTPKVSVNLFIYLWTSPYTYTRMKLHSLIFDQTGRFSGQRLR